MRTISIELAGFWPQQLAATSISLTILTLFLLKLTDATQIQDENLSSLRLTHTKRLNQTGDMHIRLTPRPLKRFPSGSLSSNSDSESMNGSDINDKRRAKAQTSIAPSYDIIDPEPPESTTHRQQAKSWPVGTNHSKNQSAEVDFNQNAELESLRTGSKSQRQQQKINKKRQHAPDPFLADLKAITSKGKSMLNRENSTIIDDDVAATNFLIGMLLMANKLVIESREKTANATSSSQDVTSGQRKSNISRRSKDKKEKELLASQTISEKGNGSSKSSEATRTSGSSKEKKESSKSAKQTQHSAKMGAEESTIKGDVISVRPGFGWNGPTETPEAPKQNSTSRRQQQQRLKRRQDYSALTQYPAGALLLEQSEGLDHIQQLQQREQDILHDHKPLIAQDLLSVHRQQLQQQQQQGAYPFGGSPPHPENMFISRPSLDRRHPLYEHLQRQTPFEQAYQQQHRDHDHEREQEHRPESNGGGHPLDWTHQQPPPLLGAHPLVSEDPFAAMRPTMHPISAEHHGSGGASNRIGGQQQQGNEIGSHPLMSPLQHMLMAAKNQQAAALAYERRRLEHELELQKRQELMKKQHDELIERERQAQAAKQTNNENPDAKSTGSDEQPSGVNQIDGDSQNKSGGQNGSNGGDSGAQEDNSGSNNSNSEGGGGGDEDQNQGQQDHQNDPDLKSFQNFGDTDFTDLFPPGILSKDEIKEMKKQQEEQKQRQEQEEQEEREKRQQQDQQEEGDSNEGNEQQQQQQQPEQQAGEQTEQQNNQGEQQQSTKSKQQQKLQQQSTVAASDDENLVGKGAQQQEQEASASKSDSQEESAQKQQTTVGDSSQNQTLTTGTEQARSNKTRRSHQSVPTSEQSGGSGSGSSSNHNKRAQHQHDHQTLSLMPIGSSYNDNYVKPFLVAPAAGYMAPEQSSPSIANSNNLLMSSSYDDSSSSGGGNSDERNHQHQRRQQVISSPQEHFRTYHQPLVVAFDGDT